MEIRANKDIIKTMIRLGVPYVPLPPKIELQIIVDKNKTRNMQTGSKSPRTQAQAMTEQDKDGKKMGEGRTQPRGKGVVNLCKLEELPEEAEDEDDRVKNRSNCPNRKRTEPEEAEGDKAKNCNKRPKGKAAEGDKEKDEVINHENRSKGGHGARKERKGSDKASNHKEPSADTLHLFALPDFLDDDDDDYELPVRKRRKGKAVPLIEDDDDDENEEGNDEDKDEDYNVDNEEGDEDEKDEDEEEDDKEINLQAGKPEERKRKKPVAVAKNKQTDPDVMVMEERPRGAGQRCANVDRGTKFRKYIRDVMKTFEGHVKKGKQVKKYLLEMIEDVRGACMNIRYLGMDFDPEEIVQTISDLSFKAWQTLLSGVEYADRNDMKEAIMKWNVNIVTSDRSNKDAGQVAQATLDNLLTAQRNDCKLMLK